MKKVLFITIAILILFSGCRSRKEEPIRFYLIEFPADLAGNDVLSPLPYFLEISDISVHPAYSSAQIAMRENDHEVTYFMRHQWASRPQQSFQRFVLRYFNLKRAFEKADVRFWTLQPDFRLTTEIINLEVVRDRRDFYARLNVRFTLIDSDGKVIDQHHSDQKRLLEKRNLNLFTQAVNNIFYEELNFFARRIHFQLKPAE